MYETLNRLFCANESFARVKGHGTLFHNREVFRLSGSGNIKRTIRIWDGPGFGLRPGMLAGTSVIALFFMGFYGVLARPVLAAEAESANAAAIALAPELSTADEGPDALANESQAEVDPYTALVLSSEVEALPDPVALPPAKKQVPDVAPPVKAAPQSIADLVAVKTPQAAVPEATNDGALPVASSVVANIPAPPLPEAITKAATKAAGSGKLPKPAKPDDLQAEIDKLLDATVGSDVATDTIANSVADDVPPALGEALASDALSENPSETPAEAAPEAAPETAAEEPKPQSAAELAKAAAENFVPEADDAFVKRLAGGDGVVSLDIAEGTAVPDIDEPIRIDEAVAFALKNNYEVKAAEAGQRSAFWDKLGGYGQYMPSMEFSVSKGTERSRPGSINDSNGDRVLDTKHKRRDRDLMLRQPILDLGIVTDILNAEDKEDVARFGNLDARETVASDTVNSFYSILQARVAIQLADQYKKYLEDIASRMTTRVEEGGAPVADLDRISARALAAESARVEAVGEYEAAVAEFKRLTGVVPAAIEIPENLKPQVPETPDDAKAQAYKNNPSYLESLKKIELAKNDTANSATDMLPTISGQYNSVYNYNAGGAALGNPIDGVYATSRSDTMLLVAKWSLHPGTSVPGAMSGLAKIRQMDYKARDVKSRMDQAIVASYTALGAAAKRKEALQKSVAANMRVVEGFEQQYSEGSRQLFDLLDAYEQLYSSQLNLMRVVIADTRASYQVRKQTGDLIPSLVQTGGE